MSLFKSIGKVLGKVSGVASLIPGIGPVLGTIGGIAGGVLAGGPRKLSGSTALVTTASKALSVLPGAGKVALGKLGTIGGGAARLGAAAAGGAVAGTVLSNGTFVPRKRRRRKGISATELKNFDRVSKFLDSRFKCSKSTRIARR